MNTEDKIKSRNKKLTFSWSLGLLSGSRKTFSQKKNRSVAVGERKRKPKDRTEVRKGTSLGQSVPIIRSSKTDKGSRFGSEQSTCSERIQDTVGTL